MGIQKDIDSVVLKNLKDIYLSRFDRKPDNVVKALNKEFSEYIQKYKNGTGSLVSSRTIRNFFDSPSPSINETTLNFLCKLMLGKDYLAALDSQSQALDFSDPIFVTYSEKTKKRVEHVALLDINKNFKLDDIYAQTYFTDLQRRKDFDYATTLKAIFPDKENISKKNTCPNPVLGIDQVKRQDKLFLLGRPGVGKTMFSKKITQIYLDPETGIRDFGEEIFPVYLPLKVCAEEILDQGLDGYLTTDFSRVSKFNKDTCSSKVSLLLNSGQAMIVLDALDETGDKFDDLCREIEKFINAFPRCRMIITSRLSNHYPSFPGFEKWEVQIFNDNQSRTFIKKLFAGICKIDSVDDHTGDKSEANIDEIVDDFFEKLPETVEELTHHPLSLTYLGMIYWENYGVSRSISEIYKDVIDIFLRKWDRVRYIRARIPEYQNKLTRMQKENLFYKLAFEGLCNSVSVWKDKEIKELLTSYFNDLSMTNLGDIDKDVDSMLKVFIMDDGLLVPVAREYFSFPFLPFQEYLSAQYLISNNFETYELIENYFFDDKWRNTFLMYSELLPKADHLFIEMFKFINNNFQDNDQLQKILHHLEISSKSCKLDTTSWRSQFLFLDTPLELFIARGTPLPDDDIIEISKLTKQFSMKYRRVKDNQPRFIIALYLAIAYALVEDKYIHKDDDNYPTLKKSRPIILETLEISDETGIAEEIRYAIEEAEEANELDLVVCLKELEMQLPEENADIQSWNDWSQSLSKIMQEHLHCGLSIHLNGEEKEEIAKYFSAVHLLLKCLTGFNAVTSELREFIFDNILLPADSIPNRIDDFY